MSVVYDTSVKTARMQAVADQIGDGGKIKIRDASNNILAVFTLPAPCGVVSGAVLDLDMAPDLVTTGLAAAGAGVAAANAIITDAADATKVSGLTVGTSGTDIILDAATIAQGQTVTLLSGTLTHA